VTRQPLFGLEFVYLAHDNGFLSSQPLAGVALDCDTDGNSCRPASSSPRENLLRAARLQEIDVCEKRTWGYIAFDVISTDLQN